MERLERMAIILKLVNHLRTAGSWCGETHVQKAAYLMQDLLHVPSGYRFIMYKHGPYSFDLADELNIMRDIGLLELRPQQPPYGPRYSVTELGHKHQERYAKTLAKFDRAIQRTAEAIGDQAVGKLERLATALYVTERQTEHHDGSVKARAEYLNRLKPHVSIEMATQAVEEIDSLIASSRSPTSESA
jgi:uncharacterized protein YwgA